MGEKEKELEQNEVPGLARRSLGRVQRWPLKNPVTQSLTQSLVGEMGVSAFAEIGRSLPITVRFAKNAVPTKPLLDASQPGIFRPCLLVLHVTSEQTTEAICLSLAEGVAVR